MIKGSKEKERTAAPGGKLLFAAVTAALGLCMAACGRENASNSESGPVSAEAEDRSGFVYVPEFISVDDEDASLYDVHMRGEDCYYMSRSYDEETETASVSLCIWSPDSRSSQQVPLSLPEDTNLNSWTVGEDGCVYAVLESFSVDENDMYETTGMELTKFDAQGNPAGSQDVREILTGEDGWSVQADMETDAQGRVYMLVRDEIYLFDGDLSPAGTVDAVSGAPNSRLSCWGHGADGRVYAVLENYGEAKTERILYGIDFESRQLGESHEGFPGSYRSTLVQDSEGKFWVYDDIAMYRFDPDTGEKEKVFSWLDSNINVDSVENYSILPDGRVMVVYADWQANDSGVALLTRTDASEIAQKQQIVIGTMSMSQELQAAAVNFNKSDGDYQITVRTYVDQDNWSGDAYEDALARFNNDITSGNGPDIIDLSSVNVQQLAAKGVFEDLNPYLDQSSALSRDDMVDSAMAACTYDGVLAAVPDGFMLETVMGSREQVGDRMGWTLEEMIAFAEAHPDQELFCDMPREIMTECLLEYNMDSFVDWSEGTCNFDSPEFKSLLEFVAPYPDMDHAEWSDDDASPPIRIQKGEVLLVRADISELNEMQLYRAMFGGDVTAIGFPNSNGSSGCVLRASGCYAINAASQVKDGAWKFIEQYLTREDPWMRMGFPNSRSRLDETAREMLQSEGNSSFGWGDFEYQYRTPTQEEIDGIMELIDAAVPAADNNDQLMDIINEEAAPFFQGQKSVDEVARIIQSRMEIYVSENSR